MNILYGRTDVNMSGPSVVMLKTACQLRCRKHNVIVASSGGYLEQEFSSCGVEVVTHESLSFKKRSAVDVVKSLFFIRKILLKYDVDVIHGHNMLFTIYAYIASLFKKKKKYFFTTIHGVGKEWLCRYLPGKIIVVSEFVRSNLISAKVPSDKIIFVPNGLIDLNDYKPDGFFNDKEAFVKSDNTPFLIVNIAMMTGLKGHDRILRVLKHLVDLGYNVKVDFIGDGPERNTLVELSKSLGVENHVDFLGTRRDVHKVLSSYDLFLHLPDYETFGMVVMEAMAAGLPIVATSTGGLRELVDNGLNGYLISNDDLLDVAKKVSLIIDDRKKRHEFGANSYRRVEGKYKIKDTVDLLESVYLKVEDV